MPPCIKKTLAGIAISLALLAPLCLSAQDQSPAKDTALDEFHQFHDAFLAALNKGDFEATLAFFHSNCVVTWHNAEVSRGHEGIRAFHNRLLNGQSKAFDSFTCEAAIDEPSVLFNRDSAVCSGTSDEHFKLTNGKTLDIKGRWSATLLKEDGRWLIANLHTSTNIFDNVMLERAKKIVQVACLICFILGIFIGWLVGRRRKSAA